MGYLSLEVEFHDLGDFGALVVPIDVFRCFVEALGENLIAANFNKYYDPQRGMVHPQIAVRVNVKNKVKAKEILVKAAESLREQGKIRHYGERPSPWNEPAFVVKAHELGTQCVLQFRDQLSRNSFLVEAFNSNRGNLLFEFIYVLLMRLGFQPFITWDLKRNFPLPENDLVEIAESCAQIYRQQAQGLESPDFVERFIHAFLNCAGQEAERIFLNAILRSECYRLIFDSTQR